MLRIVKLINSIINVLYSILKLIIVYFSSLIMATCGYLCPSCEGREFTEDGLPCQWCKPAVTSKKQEQISEEEWLNSVHFGDCCSDRVEPEQKKKESENT